MVDDTRGGPRNDGEAPGEAGAAFANSLLPYATWIEDAYRVANRQIMVAALQHAASQGLPGGHHFYLTFRTGHPGVAMPQRLRAQYPQEMTIVLQHQFWDLKADTEAQLVGVGLSFGGIPTMLAIPFDAITAFADPEVQFGLRIEPVPFGAGDAEPAGETQAEMPETVTPQAAETTQAPAEPPQVISLDAFRRRDH